MSKKYFQQKQKVIVDQNKEVAQALTKHLGGLQITDVMAQARPCSVDEHKTIYAASRIKDQLTWLFVLTGTLCRR
ncbi:MAG: hypothetical protein Q7U88_00735 [Desulfocapsaceae bacterium]|nr:hypothetical protein [Desulfocapsaceae bacterium]